MFLIGFLGTLGLTGFKISNIFHNLERYTYGIAWIVWAGTLITWFLCFAVFIIEPNRLIYFVLFNFIKLVLLVNTFLFAIENIMYLASNVTKPIEAKNVKNNNIAAKS